ncbi:TIGR03620 family F420-dependent LLM class oxidoreductase [Streptomyces yaizuensis]|uniref:LLM class F420-dependent oxidoreductase n=1 Tax=Streptomyces yaizuensis TaxID=2989713 RepID=A0ABQ5NXD8_9ACTN|nr:TIGR03620 family F420-dependent LLM class oxidoreductase [Streptomyces sp. YSPA8]GLF95022.1 LLM class F420-dependent oxidoreductase [Streptomyces sp. YSPA8]
MTTHADRTGLGRIGVWSAALRAVPGQGLAPDAAEAVAELDALGFGTLWIGSSPSLAEAAPLLAAAPRIRVATAILSVWQHPADEVAAGVARIEESAPGRFLLGLGISHQVLAPQYAKPYATMVAYLDALDAAPVPVPAGRRILAALGPKMLRLSADRSLGAHPYLVTAEHTAEARSALGPDAVLAPDLKVVPEPDLGRAREIARGSLAHYLGLENYVRSLIRLGFSEADLADGGSDRLVDALFALGSPERIRDRVAAYTDAGADHVALNVISDARAGTPPRKEWRELAAALDLGTGA